MAGSKWIARTKLSVLKYVPRFFRKPKVWFTSDNHFSHAKVINYCNRPYKDVNEMNEKMVKIWNNTVSLKDTVYCIGDFSLNVKVTEKYTPLLNGRKILISGNHCATFRFKNSIREDNMLKRYLAAGWSEVHMQHMINIGPYKVKLSHLPYAKAAAYDKRYMNFRPVPTGEDFLIAGHLHAKYLKFDNQIDVGFDGKLDLYSEEEVLALMEDPRTFIPSRLTEFYAKNNNTYKD